MKQRIIKQKINVLEKLEAEQKQLQARRDLLLSELDIERSESSEEYIDTTVEDILVKIQGLVDQLFKLETTIFELRQVKSKEGLLGREIRVGDCVTLANDPESKQYCIVHESQYVNPALGIISANSPMAQKLLSKKYGEDFEMLLNGKNTKYQLLP
jgi:transcription elongation GreA/GreB family factor